MRNVLIKPSSVNSRYATWHKHTHLLSHAAAAALAATVGENVCNNSKKRKKSCFLDFEKKRKKRTYSFTGHLITQPLILNYRKSVPVSHQHQTSCSEMRTQETMQLRSTPINQNVQRWIRMDHTPGAGNWITVITERTIWTHFDGLRTKLLLKTFYDFLIRHFKKT